MVGIVLVSHGGLAEGIKQSATMISGELRDLAAVALTPDMGPEDLKARLDQAIASFEDKKEVLFLVDLWGGTPFNQANLELSEEGHENFALLTGLNLPSLLGALDARESCKTAHELAAETYKAAKLGVRVKPENLAPQRSSVQSASPAAASQSLGKMKVLLARVDSRLLHGQVATAWTKSLGPDRIIVVSDAVSHDDMRKSFIVEAAPPGVKANVIPVQKLIDVAEDPRMGGAKVMLLFETPEDALKAIEGGVKIDHINVGSMAHSTGKTMINDAIAVDAKDIETFSALRDHGVDFDTRKVPSDSAGDIWTLFKKANLTN